MTIEQYIILTVAMVLVVLISVWVKKLVDKKTDEEAQRMFNESLNMMKKMETGPTIHLAEPEPDINEEAIHDAFQETEDLGVELCEGITEEDAEAIQEKLMRDQDKAPKKPAQKKRPNYKKPSKGDIIAPSEEPVVKKRKPRKKKAE